MPARPTPRLARSLILGAGLGSLVLGILALLRGRLKGRDPVAARRAAAADPDVARMRADDRVSEVRTSIQAGRPRSGSTTGRALRWALSHRFLLGGAAALAAAGVCGGGFGLFLYFGGFDTAASKPHFTLVALAAHNTMIHSVKKRAAAIQAPDHFTAEQVLAGAKLYEEHCIACHGGAGVSRAVWAATMTPPPPFVIDSARNWSKGDLYIILLQGVKMSAMPAWGEILPDKELWDVVAFLDAMPDLSPPDYQAMREKVRAEPTTAMGASGPAVSAWPQPLQATQPLDRAVTPGDTGLPPGAAAKPGQSARIEVAAPPLRAARNELGSHAE